MAWADDVTILAQVGCADQLHDKLVATAETMIHRLLSYGMTPNMGAGKTEAVVTPRGRNALKARRMLFNQCKCALPLTTNLTEPAVLRLVPKYRHLGSFISHKANNRNELLHRLAQGQQSIRAYSAKIYHNPCVKLPQRLTVMRATAMTATMYNMASMGPLNKRDAKLWNHGIMTMYRKMLYRLYKFDEVRHMTDEQVLIKVEQLSPEEELRIHRLRAYGQYIVQSNQFHWAILGLEQRWLGLIQQDFTWLYRHIEGFTAHPSPAQDWNYWNEHIKNNPGKWKGLLKRVTTNAILQRQLRGEVNDAHQKLLQLLHSHGAPIMTEEEVHTTEAFHCTICGKDYATYRGWAVHAFKVHGRVHHCRQLQQGRTCAACGHQFPTEPRLARRFKTSPKCAATVAAQQWWTPVTPAFGSKQVKDIESTATLQTWEDTGEKQLGKRHGWPMTTQTRLLLEAACRCQWQDPSQDLQRLRDVLSNQPVAYHEIIEVEEGMTHYYEDEETKQAIADTFAILRGEARTESSSASHKIDHEQQLRHYMDVGLYDIQTVPRCRLRRRFVLHLYSGVKRENDLHSKLLEMNNEENFALFPISLDIVLSKEHGDLLSASTQDYWAELCLRGAIHFAFGGPPCETWSVSRWRHYEPKQGPRPLRSGDDRFHEIWGWRRLKIKELRQLLCSNMLLMYMIRIFICQLCAGAGALIEHPDKPGQREGRQPASIWVLPIMHILMQCRRVTLIPVSQGYWGAISPKPTAFLITTPNGTGTLYRRWLNLHRVRQTLPPPLPMGRAGAVYNTAQLKRYPGPLCTALAYIAQQSAKQMSLLEEKQDMCQDWTESVLKVALQLKAAYDESMMDEMDGHDYHRFNPT